MIIIGIDPGIDGAFAFIEPSGELLTVLDMPVDKIEKAVGAKTRGKRKAAGKTVSGKTTGSIVSARGLWEILDGYDGGNAVAFMERMVAMPAKVDPATGQRRQMGAGSMMSYGRGGGLIEMALMARGIGVTMLSAVSWKKAVSCPTGKDGARARASQQFPLFAPLFKLKKADGRAEAALIALYGARTIIGGTA